MQVEQYEINGFVIDQFNQYNLEQKETGHMSSLFAR